MTQGIKKLSISPFFLKIICQQQIFIFEKALSIIRLKYFINLLEIIFLEQGLKYFTNIGIHLSRAKIKVFYKSIGNYLSPTKIKVFL